MIIILSSIHRRLDHPAPGGDDHRLYGEVVEYLRSFPDLPTRHRRLREPLGIVPVIAIGGEVRSKVALARLGEVQRAVLAAGVGWPNLAVWSVDSRGHTKPVPIP